MATIDSAVRSYSRGKLKNVVYNDRCGYAIVFYDPIFDLDTKIAPLKLADLPYTIPLDRAHLHNLKPAGKPVCGDKEKKRPQVPGECEAARDFIHRKLIERKMDEIRDTCYNIHKCYQKAEKFDLERRKVISPRVKAKIRGRSSDIICDVLVDDAMQNIDYVYERNLEAEEEKKKKLALIARRKAARAPKKIEKIHLEESKLKAVKEEQVEEATQTDVVTKENLEKALKRAEKKFDEIPVEKEFLRPSPPRYGFKSERVLQRQHEEKMNMRVADALLFEITYGRQLRRLKNEIKRLKEEYS